jgi:NADP-dependent 3-hydroxy acid dehydrogenase YdfG
MSKTILITGAGSGLGKGAAFGMAKNGHNIIATAQVSSQVTPLREEAAALGLRNMRFERLDLTDPYDIKQAQGWDIDVLWNNAGMAKRARSGKYRSTWCARIMRSTSSCR